MNIGTKCTTTKSDEDTKLSGEVNTSAGTATLEEDLDKLMKFNK